jgi:hypothetical protein
MNTRLIAGAAVAAALALPAAAHADASIVGGPLKVRDYQMTLIGSDAAKDSVTVMFSRTSGKSSQQHMYSFDSGVTVTPTSIKGSLGRYGAINLKLTGARTAKASLPAGCTGKPGSMKSGVLKGSFRLVADSTYFRTVSARSLKGSVTTGGSIRCDGAGGSTPGTNPGASGTTLSLTRQDPEGLFTFSATRDVQSAMRMDDAATTAPAQIMHIISAQDRGMGLDVRSGGYLGVNGIRPFLGGGDTFTATGSGPSGTLAGTLAAEFDSIGTIAIKGDAMRIG